VAKIVVPTPNTTITSAWGKSVADALNDPFVQRGNLNAVFTAGLSAVIPYPTPFAASPLPFTVAMAIDTPCFLVLVGGSTTATGFQLRGWSSSSVPLAGNLGLVWIAAGARP
jgi:hypothetical protein